MSEAEPPGAMDSCPSAPSTATTNKAEPGFDALVEDVLGLNLRGLKTIWCLVARPSEVFTAARQDDWQNRFTPSIRLYFSIIALLIFFQFIWAGEHSFMRQAFRGQFELMQSMPNIGAFNLDRAADLAIDAYLVVSPLTVGVFLLLAACVTFIWGKGTGFVTRIRLFFAALIPNTAISIFVTMASSHASPEQSMLVTLPFFLTMLVINTLTVYRGLEPTHRAGARIWRSVLFSVLVLIVYIVAGTVSQVIVGFWAGMQVINADLADLTAGLPG